MTKQFMRCLVIDGKAFASIEEAQKYELEKLLTEFDFASQPITPETITAVATFLVIKSDRVQDILSTNEKSRPKARKINGGKKKRKKEIVYGAAANAVTV